jgi:hypothetical protein
MSVSQAHEPDETGSWIGTHQAALVVVGTAITHPQDITRRFVDVVPAGIKALLKEDGDHGNSRDAAVAP